MPANKDYTPITGTCPYMAWMFATASSSLEPFTMHVHRLVGIAALQSHGKLFLKSLFASYMQLLQITMFVSSALFQECNNNVHVCPIGVAQQFLYMYVKNDRDCLKRDDSDYLYGNTEVVVGRIGENSKGRVIASK
jgi:hypothetical protein